MNSSYNCLRLPQHLVTEHLLNMEKCNMLINLKSTFLYEVQNNANLMFFLPNYFMFWDKTINHIINNIKHKKVF